LDTAAYALPPATLDFTPLPPLPSASKGCVLDLATSSDRILVTSRDRRVRLFDAATPYELHATFYIKDYVPQKAWFASDATTIYILGNTTYLFYYAKDRLIRTPTVLGHKRTTISNAVPTEGMTYLLAKNGYVLAVSNTTH
jgi:hypothetical protein